MNGIGSIELPSPFVVAPMAGMTDTAFRRLVKRHGGCGLVVTEMVSSEGLVRGIDRTLEYAEYTEEERPVSIQIFGGDPDKMAAAAQIVEGMGADIVDVNMGCPVPKIAKHNAGCSLMREPEHAATVIEAMAKAVKIPVTVKMRAGWNDTDAQRAGARAEGAGCGRCGGHDSRSHRRAVLQRRRGLGAGCDSRERSADSSVRKRRLRRAGADRRAHELRRLAECLSAAASCEIRGFLRRPRISLPVARLATVTMQERGQFLLDYIDLLLDRARARTSRLSSRRAWRRPDGRQRLGVAGTSAGLSTSCERCVRGIRRGSTQARSFGLPSTAPRVFRTSVISSRTSS